MVSKQDVAIVAPLDWGLGHATRCVPLIRRLQSTHRVILASDGRAAAFLRREFPELPLVELPSYGIRYPTHPWAMVPAMVLQLPRLWMTLRAEQGLIQRLADENRCRVIFSDNRPGCHARGCRNVYMTHQVTIAAPTGLHWAEPWGARLHAWAYRAFDEVWIPDLPSPPGLAGKLSHGFRPIGARFVGILSRFTASSLPRAVGPGREVIALLSGPEPQRTMLEQRLADQARAIQQPLTIVRGQPECSEERIEGCLRWISHLETPELLERLRAAELVICRPGYSSLMDLTRIGVRALLVPTPGQTEQEWLGDHLARQGWFHSVRQDRFDLKRDMALAQSTPGMTPVPATNSEELLAEALAETLHAARSEAASSPAHSPAQRPVS